MSRPIISLPLRGGGICKANDGEVVHGNFNSHLSVAFSDSSPQGEPHAGDRKGCPYILIGRYFAVIYSIFQ